LANKKILDELRWKKISLLSDGFVCLVDAMGSDTDICDAARVSFNKDNRDSNQRLFDAVRKLRSELRDMSNEDIAQHYNQTLPDALNLCADDDRKLLRYLLRHRHTTPFEQCEMKFLIRIPMDAWRQMIRHRTANVNEYSTRYVEAIDRNDVTPSDGWRSQSKNNKQGSSGEVEGWPDYMPDTHLTPGEYLSAKEFDFHKQAREVYQERLAFGVAREQARKDLPLSTYTEAYWKCDLHNILHFLGLRMDSHAQKEIRDYANAMASIVKQLFPVTYQAFLDYRLNAIQLSALDIQVIQEASKIAVKPHFEMLKSIAASIIIDPRERTECVEKCVMLGVCQKGHV
jgi:thymidylate synthase (FAD)